MLKKKTWFITAAAVCVATACAAAFMLWQQRSSKDWVRTDSMKKQELVQVQSVAQVHEQYDVIVVGTDPEGLAAAISASRNGAKTLLIEPRTERTVLGGLMTEGWLNSIDMNWDKTVRNHGKGKGAYLNHGIFTEWYDQIESHSFDVTTAANAFYKLVKAEKNIDLLLGAKAVDPVVGREGGAITVKGIEAVLPDGVKQTIHSPAVIDATQDADFAAAAGASFTIGREDIGDPNTRMAVTAVFRLKNVNDSVWKQIVKRVDGSANTAVSGYNNWTAWGYDEEMQGYKPLNPERTRMRGLNIGRQRDGTALVNALQIFGVDGLDEASRKEGLEIAHREVPNVVKYLQQYDEFKHVELDAIAPELYVRETRHLKGLYRLTVIDLLENRDQWDRIAFGSYSSDLQRSSPHDSGNIAVHPEKYAVPFRSIVPKEVNGLLVVGRSASFDTLAHGSARVIPVGMATGQAAGTAAVLAGQNGVTFREMAEKEALIRELQDRLNEQGMQLKPYKLSPEPYMKHKAYRGLSTAVSLGIANGGYNNSAFTLDHDSNAMRMANSLKLAEKRYPEQLPGNSLLAINGITDPGNTPLSLEQAAYTIACSLNQKIERGQALSSLLDRNIIQSATLDLIKDKEKLTDGDSYLLLNDLVKSFGEDHEL